MATVRYGGQRLGARGTFPELAPALLWRLQLGKRADQALLPTSDTLRSVDDTHSGYRKISAPADI